MPALGAAFEPDPGVAIRVTDYLRAVRKTLPDEPDAGSRGDSRAGPQAAATFPSGAAEGAVSDLVAALWGGGEAGTAHHGDDHAHHDPVDQTHDGIKDDQAG